MICPPQTEYPQVYGHICTAARIRFVLFVLAATASLSYSKESSNRSVLLKNPGFEARRVHRGWSLHVYGARPTLVQDTTVRHEGRQSLRISASKLSDTALAQEVKLQPGRLYRFTGWVRTQNLNPHGAPIHGTFRITSGKDILAQGRNHQGNTEWIQERILFIAPHEAKTRLSLFFVGHGKGTGTVWFDDISLEQVRSLSAYICVRRDFTGTAQISPFQYGQFIEPLGDLIPAMWSERLYNASFEGVNRCKLTFREETDFAEKLWYPIGEVNRGDYALDEENPFNGKVSQRIAVNEYEPCTLGIAQGGIFVEKDKTYHFSVHLRQKNLREPVRACLRAGPDVLAEVKFSPIYRWQKYSASLVPSATTRNATFALEFHGPATVWIDQVSLMPQDSVGGWRPDVVEAVKALKPGIIRWGGSTMEHYDWRNLIGDPDRRAPWLNHPWGGMHPTGAGLEEFVQLCRAVDAEPLICVRVTGKEPTEGAAQVQYFNGEADTPMGRLRAQNGHPKPCNVKYWQVGNEVHGNAQRLAAFCTAMKAVDPSIRLLSSYPDADVVREAGKYLNYLCPHHYGQPDLLRRAEDFETLRRWAAEHAPGRELKIAVTEWAFARSVRATGLKRAELWSLDNALLCSLYHNLLHRYADLVEIAIRSNLTNSACSGIIQTNNSRLYKTPTYYAEHLYSRHAGTHPLEVELNGDLMQDHVSATLSEDKRNVTLFVVNNQRFQCNATIDLTPFGSLEKTIHVWTLMDTQQAGQRDVTNSFDEPERVRPVPSTVSVESAKFDYTFPPLTLTVLKCPVNS